VLKTVHFDIQLRLDAEEIQNVRTNGVLSAKLITGETMTAEP